MFDDEAFAVERAAQLAVVVVEVPGRAVRAGTRGGRGVGRRGRRRERRHVDEVRPGCRLDQPRGTVVEVLDDRTAGVDLLVQAVGGVVQAPAVAITAAGRGPRDRRRADRAAGRAQGHVDRVAAAVDQARERRRRQLVGVAQRARDEVVGVVEELGQRAVGIDLGDLAAGGVVQDVGPHARRVLDIAQAAQCVVAVLGGRQRGRALPFEQADQLARLVEDLGADQSVGERRAGLGVEVVVGGDGQRAVEIRARQHASQAVVGVDLGSAGPDGRQPLQQVAEGVVDVADTGVLGSRAVERGHAVGAHPGRARFARQRSAVVVGVIGAHDPALVEQAVAPGVERRFGVRRAGMQIRGVLVRRSPQALRVVAVLGDAALAAAYVTQSMDTVIQVARDGRRARQARTRAIGVGREVDGLGVELVVGVIGSRDGVAGLVALQGHQALGVVLIGDDVALGIGDGADVAVGVVAELHGLRHPADRRRGDAGQAVGGVVAEDGGVVEGVGQRGGAIDGVVRDIGDAQDTAGGGLGDPGDSIGRADQRVDEVQPGAIGLGDRGHARAGAVVGVGGVVGGAGGDGVVVRAEIDTDAAQPAAGVVLVAHAGARDVDVAGVLVNRADLRQQRAGVIEVDALGGVARADGDGRLDAGQLTGGVVRISDLVAAGITLGGDAAAAGVVVALGGTGVAVGPGPGAARQREEVMRTVTGLGLVPRGGAVVRVDGLGAVPVGADDGAAGGVDGAGQAVDAFVKTRKPVVVVAVVELAEAVVGTVGDDVEPAAEQQLVAALDDEVAGGGIEEDAVGASPDPGIADRTAPTQKERRRVTQPQPIARHHRNHATPRLIPAPCADGPSLEELSRDLQKCLGCGAAN